MTDAPAVPGPPFTHTVDVRYGECDQQGIVFNAHYLAFVDDAMDHWMRSFPSPAGATTPWVDSWDVMLKQAHIDWQGPARWTETLSIDCGVARWGRTSFDAVFHLRVGSRSVADVLITYVSVDPASHVPMSTPAEVVAAMGEPAQVPESLATRH